MELYFTAEFLLNIDISNHGTRAVLGQLKHRVEHLVALRSLRESKGK